jgi:hypothetical protein
MPDTFHAGRGSSSRLNGRFNWLNDFHFAESTCAPVRRATSRAAHPPSPRGSKDDNREPQRRMITVRQQNRVLSDLMCDRFSIVRVDRLIPEALRWIDTKVDTSSSLASRCAVVLEADNCPIAGGLKVSPIMSRLTWGSRTKCRALRVCSFLAALIDDNFLRGDQDGACCRRPASRREPLRTQLWQLRGVRHWEAHSAVARSVKTPERLHSGGAGSRPLPAPLKD